MSTHGRWPGGRAETQRAMVPTSPLWLAKSLSSVRASAMHTAGVSWGHSVHSEQAVQRARVTVSTQATVSLGAGAAASQRWKQWTCRTMCLSSEVPFGG
jgi:hypothetical protein